MKPLCKLEIEDFDKYKVWQFAKDESGDFDFKYVVPIRSDAVIFENDVLVIVAVTATLANGIKLNGIAEVNGDPPEICPGLSLNIGDKWFRLLLPPAPPFVLEKEGPAAFATFIDYTETQIFPIAVKTNVIFQNTGETLSEILK